MKALPMWQPWASLVVKGHKRIETRDYPAPQTLLDRRIAIYATKTRLSLSECKRWPFSLYVNVTGCPLGAILGTVHLRAMSQVGYEARRDAGDIERAFGDFSTGRWLWHLAEPVEFTTPIPRNPSWGRGQGIFVVPDHVIDEAS